MKSNEDKRNQIRPSTKNKVNTNSAVKIYGKVVLLE